jgi:small-conductance mechanosensitive channel
VEATNPATAGGAQNTAPAAPTSALPATAASASVTAYEPVEVRIRDVLILRLKLADGGLIPSERAKRATRAIEAALADTNPEAVRTELRQDRALLFVGKRPIVELTRADAEVTGEGSLELFAASAAARVSDVLENERQRSAWTHGVFNVTFVVFLAVVVLYALRLIGGLTRRVREFVRRNPDQIPAIRLRSIEVVGPHILRSSIVVGLGFVKLLLQLSLIFAWLLFSSSLFDVTRGMTDKLTALVIAPLSGLATRFAALLPLLLLTTIAGVVLVVLLRFVTLFFLGVERRETDVSWLRPELAAPTSLLIRVGMVVASLLVLAPLVTGNADGSLARVGMLAVVAITLATTPLVANVIVGLITLYGNRLSLGDEIHVGAHTGKLTAVDLVELRLTSEDGRELRVPHLVTLVHPLSVAPQRGPTRQLVVTAEAPLERVTAVLTHEAVAAHTEGVSILRLETSRTTLALVPKHAGEAIEQQLIATVARVLTSHEVTLVLAEWQPRA